MIYGQAYNFYLYKVAVSCRVSSKKNKKMVLEKNNNAVEVVSASMNNLSVVHKVKRAGSMSNLRSVSFSASPKCTKDATKKLSTTESFDFTAADSTSPRSSFDLSHLEVKSLTSLHTTKQLMCLTDEDCSNIMRMWKGALLKKNFDDAFPATYFAQSFYERLFELDPTAKLLFGDMFVESQKISAMLHVIVNQTCETIQEGSERINKMEKKMKDLSHIHVKKGVDKRRLILGGRAFLHALETRYEASSLANGIDSNHQEEFKCLECSCYSLSCACPVTKIGDPVKAANLLVSEYMHRHHDDGPFALKRRVNGCKPDPKKPSDKPPFLHFETPEELTIQDRAAWALLYSFIADALLNGRWEMPKSTKMRKALFRKTEKWYSRMNDVVKFFKQMSPILYEVRASYA